MTTPDSIVAANGVTVTHSRVTTAAYDAAGSYDESASTVASASIKAVKSQPRNRILPPRLQGQDHLHITVPSGTDVSATRAGRPDRFTIDGVLWEVVEVRDDRHPMTGIRKKTVLLTPVASPLGAP